MGFIQPVHHIGGKKTFDVCMACTFFGNTGMLQSTALSHGFRFHQRDGVWIQKGVSMSQIATTPRPPYYAVIFTSLRTAGDNGYREMADRMADLASKQPGFLGAESAREDVGITVSYWSDLASIKRWKDDIAHKEAQRLGREKWYRSFRIRISKVERDYGI
jgi:heme-degrading monooxygenase HmoA